ncbi:MAG: ATP-binding protein [Anaerosomatales bacterium]|nr:ATP-binding protein [Anaerosomatales bacterium]MDT8434553.1 ATP-binding protein [Anaerosomatales bacterium]
MTEQPRSAEEAEAQRRAVRLRAVIIVVAMLAVVTTLHLYTNVAGGAVMLHLLYRRLYYVPILYAAFVFGKKGGLLTALAASVPFAINAQITLGGFTGRTIDSSLEVFMYFAIGVLFGALRDMEERKTADLRQVSARLEEAYKKLEERAIQLINIQDYTQSILRSITSGVLTIGPDGSITTANPAAERLLGMSEYEMVPKSIGALFRDDGGLEGDVRKVLSGRIPLTLREVRMVTDAGHEIHVQASTSRMRAVGGRILGAVVTIEDVSEVKALTEQLMRADRLAAMGELTAGVAHEVRNPLGVIRASVQLLEDAECDAERVRQAGEVMKQEIDRLDKVIKALLDFGRPSKPTMLATDVSSVLGDVVLFTSRFAAQSEVTITGEYAPDLPRVTADPDQLKQVFLNLITNAVQSMEETGGAIRLSAHEQGDFVVVTLSDTGPGIPAEDLGKVFDPFYSTRDAGTGLGLTIVHRIIDEHDGHIELESSPEGTTIRVALPTAFDYEPMGGAR